MFKIVDVQMMNMCMIMSESNFEEDSFDSNILMTMLDTLYQSSHPFGLNLMQTAQLNNDSLMSIVSNYITSSGRNNTIYMYKCVEGIVNSFTRLIRYWFQNQNNKLY